LSIGHDRPRSLGFTPAGQGTVASGANAYEVARLLVASGAWTEDAALEIISTVATSDPSRKDLLAWPGPVEEVGPLSAR
jgi:hypothetical protein